MCTWGGRKEDNELLDRQVERVFESNLWHISQMIQVVFVLDTFLATLGEIRWGSC